MKAIFVTTCNYGQLYNPSPNYLYACLLKFHFIAMQFVLPIYFFLQFGSCTSIASSCRWIICSNKWPNVTLTDITPNSNANLKKHLSTGWVKLIAGSSSQRKISNLGKRRICDEPMPSKRTLGLYKNVYGNQTILNHLSISVGFLLMLYWKTVERRFKSY